MEDRQAIARLRKGDLYGLEALVKRYQVKAVHAASLIVQDRTLAEDIVQNAFIVAAEKIQQYDPTRPFGPWFLRSVVNAAIKAARRQGRQVSLDETLAGEEDRWVDQLVDSGLQPEEWLEQQETRAQVWQALDRLSPEQRAVIVMRYFLEMSEIEMVTQLHRPKSTVKFWLRKARERLRQFLVPRSVTHLPAVEQTLPTSEKKDEGEWHE